MWLVAGIHNATVECGLERDFLLEVVCALRDLETRLLRCLADSDASRADDHLASDEERNQRLREPLKIGVAGVQVVFVAAVGATLAIDIVLVELQRRARIVIGEDGNLLLPQVTDVSSGVIEDVIARCVINHGVQSVRAFWA